jgi:hypothetical protein
MKMISKIGLIVVAGFPLAAMAVTTAGVFSPAGTSWGTYSSFDAVPGNPFSTRVRYSVGVTALSDCNLSIVGPNVQYFVYQTSVPSWPTGMNNRVSVCSDPVADTVSIVGTQKVLQCRRSKDATVFVDYENQSAECPPP